MKSPKVKLRRFKFWWNLAFAYLIKYRYRVLIFLITISAVIVTFLKFWPKVSQSNTVNIGYIGVYSLETIPAEILSLATESLISQDESGRPVGQLASQWTLSEDKKTYIVFLKDNLKWHDGTNVEAKDISIAISGVKITALNNKAIEFKLESPISSFPLALNKPVFKSKSFYGTGLFRIVDIDQIDNIVKKISLTPKEPKFPRVNIKFYQTESQAAHALKIGEIKSVEIYHSQELENWPTLNSNRQIDYSKIVSIFLKNEDYILSSKEFRQALYYAINKSDFEGIASHSPISQSSWASDPNRHPIFPNGNGLPTTRTTATAR